MLPCIGLAVIVLLCLGLAMFISSSAELSNSLSDAVFEPPFLAFTIATRDNDGYKQLMKSAEFNNIPVQTLGMGKTWKGGDTSGPSGGFKINLMKEALEGYKHMNNLIILFVDGYDQIFLGSRYQIVEKFLNFSASIVFSAETTAWPDGSLRSKYPETDSKYKYLNSGGYIGYAKDIYELLRNIEVDNEDDDQLAFTRKFLRSVQDNNGAIKLDYKAEIFQTLYLAENDVEIRYEDDDMPYLLNTVFNTKPLIVHGNGESKHVVNSIGNYLPNNWSPKRGCVECQESQNNIDFSNGLQPPHVLLGIFIDSATPFIQEFFEKILALDYPNARLSLFLFNNAPFHDEIVDDFLKKSSFKNVKVLSLEDHFSIIEARSLAIQYCLSKLCDYYFYLERNAHLDNPNTLKLLMKQNKMVISPLLRRPNLLWSNFWGSIDSKGFYSRSFDYMDIIHNEKEGLWNVPYISSAILMNTLLFKAKELQPVYSYKDLDPDMSFCRYYREMFVFMYVDNQHTYGHLINTDNFDPAWKNPDFYEMTTNKYDWELRYLHPDYHESLKPETVNHQPCPDVYWFPIVTPRFCKELVEIVENFGEWSDGSNSDTRLSTGYEAVPTRDIHMTQVGLQMQWLEFLRIYVRPLQEHVFLGYHHEPPRALLNFVVRYKPDEQPSLRPHHDSSTYTINIALNEHGKDYEGGGCNFIRYKCTVKETRLGWMLMHPGRLTHYHEGLPVTNGTRYIMISFVDP